jgi:hypothetical protein
MTDTGVEYLPLGRPKGSRNKRTAELFQRLEARGDLDPADLLSSIVSNPEEPKELRIQASSVLLPYMHPKWQSTPSPRYPEDQIKIPEFTSLAVAESFLASIPVLVDNGKLDFDFAKLYQEITMGWIQSQYAKQGIDLKAQAQGATDHDTVIRIEGGLPALPGTNVTMPNLTNGPDSYEMLDHQNPSSIDGVHEAVPATLSDSTPPETTETKAPE